MTGAAGRIGQIVLPDLERSYDVVATSLRGEGGYRALDVADLDAIVEALDGCSAVVHLAGRTARSQPSINELVSANVHGTWNIFHAAAVTAVERVVFASSNHVVGMHEDRLRSAVPPNSSCILPVELPVAPRGHYGLSKAFGEMCGAMYAEQTGLAVVSLRLGAVLETEEPPRSGGHVASAAEHRHETSRLASVWLSWRDLRSLVRAALTAPIYGSVVAYGVSDNLTRIWSLEPGLKDLGWYPADGIGRP